MDLIIFIGNLALVFTVASNFAGLPLCLKFQKSKTTANFTALPFIAGVICTSLWLQYGILVKDSTVIVVNAIAVVMQAIYTLCYYYFTINRKQLHQQLFLAGAFLSSAFAYILFLVDSKVRAINTIGILACASSIFACAAPMASIKEVFKTKSTEVLPFFIILASFFVTTLWFIYGMLKEDVFIQVPNFIGMILCSFQLSFFVVFQRKGSKKEN